MVKPVAKKGKSKSSTVTKAVAKVKKSLQRGAKTNLGKTKLTARAKKNLKKVTQKAKKKVKRAVLGRNPLASRKLIEKEEAVGVKQLCSSCKAQVLEDDIIECPNCGNTACVQCLPEGESCPKCNSEEEEELPEDFEEMEPVAEPRSPESSCDDDAIPDPAFDKIRVPTMPEEEGDIPEPGPNDSLFAEEGECESDTVDDDDVYDGDDADDDAHQEEQ